MKCTRLWMGWVALLACLLLAACATSSSLTQGGAVVVGANGLPAPDSRSSSFGAATEYQIGALDLLTVSVFGVAELTADVRVNENGDISLPLIGVVRAGGKSVTQLDQDITQKLSATYLQAPQVSVFIKEYNSQRVTVEGAVTKPGIVPVLGPTTLLQVIAMSGGLTEIANHHVIVFRSVNDQKMAAAFDIDAIGHGSLQDPQIYGNDTVVVDISGAKSRWHELLQALPLVNVFTVL